MELLLTMMGCDGEIESWFASPCMGWIMIGSFDRLCGWYLGMAYGRESHIDAPSHEISYNTINASHTQMLVPRQIPPFYGSMIIMIDWIWLWDPTSIPFPEKRNPYCLFPTSMVESFFIFCMVETWNWFFLIPHDISVHPHVFLLQTIELIETNPLELRSMLDFPVCLLYPHDQSHDIHREIRCIMKSKNSLWTLSPKAMELPPHGSSTLFLGCAAGCGLEGCDNGCRDTYTTPKPIGLPIQWPLFIWIDRYPSKMVT